MKILTYVRRLCTQFTQTQVSTYLLQLLLVWVFQTREKNSQAKSEPEESMQQTPTNTFMPQRAKQRLLEHSLLSAAAAASRRASVSSSISSVHFVVICFALLVDACGHGIFERYGFDCCQCYPQKCFRALKSIIEIISVSQKTRNVPRYK